MLSSKLKKFREACGLTQQQVADTLQIDRSTYSYYEIGKTTPDLKTIKKLIKIFNISYVDILDDNENNMNMSINVNDVSNEICSFNLDNINQLTKNEKNLIMAYRLLSNEEKKNILKMVKDKVTPK